MPSYKSAAPSKPKRKSRRVSGASANMEGSSSIAVNQAPAKSLLDLSGAVIVCPEKPPSQEKKAVAIFVEEIEKRTGIRLPCVHRAPAGGIPAVFIGCEQALRDLFQTAHPALEQMDKPGREGYRILAEESGEGRVYVVGADSRGVLFGVGKLLRKLRMSTGVACIERGYKISSTPRFPIRGHQLGYRPISNTYDAWTVAQFDQYIRELALFGANSIEIMPGGTDEEDVAAALNGTCHGTIPENHGEATAWPLMKVPYDEMMARLSETIHSYGLDVWVWWPNLFKDCSDSQHLQSELKEREEAFRNMPFVDELFIPGGDPGDLSPDELFSWSEKVAGVLHRYHPKSRVWLSLQAFRQPDEWVDCFCAHVRREPDWLGGIIYAPWQKTPLPELRSMIPAKYPIRICSDITHTLNCQFPVPQWDRVFAMTEGRECINPEPVRQKRIHNLLCEYAVGSVGYSEGINDDVNKFVLSDQDWNPETPVEETLRDYGRLFIGSEYAETVAAGLLALEKNWEGPLAKNEGVEATFKLWQEMEASASSAVLGNYRFQLGLMRAYADAYLRRRLLYEADLECKARELLRKSTKSDSLRGLAKAEECLQRSAHGLVENELRQRCHALADALFDSVGAQFSVQKHEALAWNRAGFMETLDLPLNDSAWLLAQLQTVRQCENEAARRQLLLQMLDRTDPGEGGYYDNFGTAESMKRARISNGTHDPGNLKSQFINFAVWFLHLNEKEIQKIGGPVPLAWITNLSTLYGKPLVISYDGFDPTAEYLLRVTYVATYFGNGKIRLVANDKHVIHDGLQLRKQVEVKEFPIFLASNNITLKWTVADGFHGPNIAELWIEKRPYSLTKRTV